MPTPIHFDAQFETEEEDLTVGPFDTVDQAQTYGEEQQTGDVRFVGVARRVGRQELARVIGQLQTGPSGQGTRAGVVTRWDTDATMGFLTDENAVSWFVSRDNLPDGRLSLPVGTEVTFAGVDKPKYGKRYPEAYSIKVR